MVVFDPIFTEVFLGNDKTDSQREKEDQQTQAQLDGVKHVRGLPIVDSLILSRRSRSSLRELLVDGKYRPGSLDPLQKISHYDTMMRIQESKLLVVSGLYDYDLWSFPWLATIATGTVKRLEEENKIVISTSIDHPVTLQSTFMGLILQMREKGYINESECDTIFRIDESSGWIYNDLDYMSRFFLPFINKMQNYESIIHIVIDGISFCQGTTTEDIMTVLKEIVAQAIPRVEILAVAFDLGWVSKTDVRLRRPEIDDIDVLVHIKDHHIKDHLLSNVLGENAPEENVPEENSPKGSPSLQAASFLPWKEFIIL